MNNDDEVEQKIIVPGLPVQVSEKFAREIVEAAVAAFGKADSPAGANLRRVVRRRIVIPGFRAGKTDKAKPFQIRRPLMECWTKFPDLADAVLEAWEEQHGDLIATCTAWVQKHWSFDELESLNDEQGEEADSEEMGYQALDALVIGVLNQNPEVGSEEQVRLAITLIIKDSMESREEADETKMEEPVQEDGNPPMENENGLQDKQKWEELLEWIRQIPAEDECWQSLDGLLDAIRSIAISKQAKREQSEILRHLDQALEEQRPALVDGADYFQIQGVDSWTAASCSPKQAAEAMTELATLSQLLQDFKQLEQKRPATWVERRTREEDLHRLEEQILSRFQALQNLFEKKPKLEAPGEPQPPAGAGFQQEEVAPEEKNEQQGPLPEAESTVEAETAEPLKAGTPAGQFSGPAAPVEGTAGAGIQPPLQEQGPSPAPPVIERQPEEASEQEPGLEEQPVQTEPHPEPFDTRVAGAPAEAVLEEEQPQEQALPGAQDLEKCDPILRYLAEDKLPQAYWLSWSLEQLGRPGCAPSWLIAATQGALWHLALWPEPPDYFAESISDLVQPSSCILHEEHHALAGLYLATGVYMNLIDPTGRWENWLEAPQSEINLHVAELLQIVCEANKMGIHLDPLIVRTLTDIEAAEQRISQISQQAQEWLQQAPMRGAHILRTAQVWQTLVRPPHGELYEVVQKVAADHRSDAGEVLRQLERWKDRSWLDRQIQRIDLELHGRKSRAIVGSARDQIISWVIDIAEIVEQWSQAVIQHANTRKGGDWTASRVQELCRACNRALDAARQEIHELVQTATGVAERTAWQLSGWIFEGLSAITSLRGFSALATYRRPPYLAEIQGMSPRPTLLEHLAHPLLLYPELDLNNNGLPDPAAAVQLVALFVAEPPHSPEEALRGWIASRDYRFTHTLLSCVPDRELWEIRVSEALRSDLQRLENKDIEETVITVEQALLEGLIAEEEHTGFRSRIESVRAQLRRAERDNTARLSIRHLSSQLAEVRLKLQAKREERLLHQRSTWEGLKKNLLQVTGRNRELARKIETVVEQSLDEQDLRASGEYLAHLSDVLNGVKELAPVLFDARPAVESDIVLDFQAALPGLINVLDESRSRLSLDRIGEMLLNDRPIQGFPMPRLPKSRLEEAARALEAWRRLKKNGQNQSEANLSQVETLMSYLGFSLIGNRPVSLQPLAGGLPNFQHWRVTATAGSFSPVAQFGTLRNGYYDVIGVWERPGFEIISSQVNLLMRQTGNQPTILLYFGRLLPAQREDLLSITHKGHLPMLVVDETLVLFLTRLYGTRLKPMFHCTLPYAALNPFFPAAAGLVPPEVFKGRANLVQKLVEPLGPAIVYGGRQLGKSALLRQVQREFHRPENGQYVIYEDIKLVGDPASGKNYKTDLCDRLVMALGNQKLVEKPRAALDLDRLLSHLQQKISEENLRVLLLLDEADHFLDADAEKNFFFIQKLKNMMDQTERRFKVILAGLHNVQRFQRISNQPLAHLETGSIEIGPLDPEPARELLEEPLHALGFRFGEDPRREDTSLVLHILSYTNYHPGLIQLFGQSLVEHLLKKYHQPARLPLLISRSDVEDVYRKKDVREEICKRFNWTLALDPRYEAITLALILEQWDDQNGFDRLYSPKQLQNMASSWWPEAFGDEITDDQFKSFLDEMRGLGVLSTDQDGNYRLRSPNIVSLMGTHDQLWERLAALVQGPPPGERALEYYHALLEGESFSPLTFVQERALNNPESGVALIFGSPALGIRSLNRALKCLMPEGLGAWCEVRIAARNANAIHQQLSSFVHDNPSASFLVAYRELDGTPEELAEQVLAAVHYCQQIRSRTLRVCFEMDSSTAWQWFQLPKENREKIEKRASVIVTLRRWDHLGIKQRLEMELWNGGEVIVTDHVVNKVLDVTGGWPFLLDEFFQRKDRQDHLTALGEFRRNLHDTSSLLSQDFIKSLGLYDPLPRRVIGALLDDEISRMIQEGHPYEEVLSLVLEDLPTEALAGAMEYLGRMAIITSASRPAIEPVLAQLWHEA